MKQTEEDRHFAKRFAEALQPHVTRARERGMSLEQVGAKLGVTASGLQRQLAGATPSIRTVALAYAMYGVAVPYDSVDVARALSKRSTRKRDDQMQRQLELPLEITAPAASKKLVLKRLPGAVRRYRLQLIVGI